ncbi:MAG: type II toxin-antitoxin system RelE/ParE family toxin [Candidatus Lindowbacteria bacterium]|nr:type II toxin-antitoxin system RelE/ParE family toxin [Candidatus Lindowbacteria bacterium]
MKRTFIEIPSFQKAVIATNDRSLLRLIQNEILKNPKGGSLLKGCGGIRKIRVGDEEKKKGKSGGYRVLHLDLPDRGKNYLLKLFAKGEKENISDEEKKIVRKLVKIIKEEK